MNSLTQIEAASTKARFTSVEFLQMCDAGAFADMKVELVDGELERMTPAKNPHSGRQTRVIARLLSIFSEEFVRVEAGILLDDESVLGCDVAVLRVPMVDDRIFEPADFALVVEIAETTIARDMGMKRIKYAAAGIAEYWVVDGARSVVHVFGEPIDGDYASISTVRFGAPLAVPGTERTIVID